MTPRARAGAPAETREQILDAALSVIQTHGLGRTTTKEIAQAAGISEAALYRHFADKTELCLCVMAERVPQLMTAVQDLAARVGRRTVRTNLEEIVRVALPLYEEAVPVEAALFAEPELLARHQERLRTNNVGPHRAGELLASYIRAEQRLGRIARHVDPEATAWLLLGTCIGRTLVRRFVGQPASLQADERFIKSLLHTLMVALASDKPASAR
jgi:AcrR family transcriptional regulator